MKAKHKRLIMVLLSLTIMAGAATAILYSFRENMVFFYTPTQLAEKRLQPDFVATREMRIGGIVKNGSIKNLEGGGIAFVITDLTNEIATTYKGMVPSLFRESQGVIAQGKLSEDGKSLVATNILAKHDEKYMPREVVESLKASGQWKEDREHDKENGHEEEEE